MSDFKSPFGLTGGGEGPMSSNAMTLGGNYSTDRIPSGKPS